MGVHNPSLQNTAGNPPEPTDFALPYYHLTQAGDVTMVTEGEIRWQKMREIKNKFAGKNISS